MGEEAEALFSAHMGDWAEEDMDEMDEERNFKWIASLKKQYAHNKRLLIGEAMDCPMCDKRFRKKTKAQVFCGRTKKGKKSTRCKDQYWNTVDDRRRSRARSWNRG